MKTLILILFTTSIFAQKMIPVKLTTDECECFYPVVNDILEFEGTIYKIESEHYNAVSNESGIYSLDTKIQSSSKVHLGNIKDTDKPVYYDVLGAKMNKPNVAGTYTLKYGTLTTKIIYYESNNFLSTYGAINDGL